MKPSTVVSKRMRPGGNSSDIMYAGCLTVREQSNALWISSSVIVHCK